MSSIADDTATPHLDRYSRRLTTDSLAGAWTPHGGGSNFAKQEIIVGIALIFSMLVINLVDTERSRDIEPNMKSYGLGTLPPQSK